MAVFKEQQTQKSRYICDCCGFKGRRYDEREEADAAERRHLIKRHDGDEVWPPVQKVLDAMGEDAYDTFDPSKNMEDYTDEEWLMLPTTIRTMIAAGYHLV